MFLLHNDQGHLFAIHTEGNGHDNLGTSVVDFENVVEFYNSDVSEGSEKKDFEKFVDDMPVFPKEQADYSSKPSTVVSDEKEQQMLSQLAELEKVKAELEAMKLQKAAAEARLVKSATQLPDIRAFDAAMLKTVHNAFDAKHGGHAFWKYDSPSFDMHVAALKAVGKEGYGDVRVAYKEWSDKYGKYYGSVQEGADPKSANVHGVVKYIASSSIAEYSKLGGKSNGLRLTVDSTYFQVVL